MSSFQQKQEAGFYARKIVENDERINWRNNANQIINQIRAFSPHIGAYAQFKGKRVKILDAKTTNIKNQADILVFQNKKHITEMGYKMSAASKDKLEAEIKAVMKERGGI